MINNKLYRNGSNGLNGSNGAGKANGRHGASELRGLRCASLSFIIFTFSFFISLTSLVACSSDSTDEMTTTETTTETTTMTKSVPVEVASYVTWFDETMVTNGVKGDDRTTRAWTVPTGYMAYEGGTKSIGIAFTKDGEDPTEGANPLDPKSMIGNFFFSSGKWRTSVEGIGNKTYFLYGYIPYSPGIKYSITDRDDANAKYSEGAKMKLVNVPTVMTNDLCVVIGAKDGTDKETVTGLRKGDFSVIAKETSDEEPKNFVFLLFDHIYSALCVKMRVHPDYDDLRTIRLDTLMLSTQVGETISKDHSDITITLTPNDGSASPITDISYAPTSTAKDIKDGIMFWSSDNATGQLLTTTYQDFTGHFMPSGINTLKLTSVYDIYDKKGNLLRENCKATNTMVISELFDGQTVADRGKQYTVSMTIQPTYLYMLSEPDLENPTVVMN